MCPAIHVAFVFHGCAFLCPDRAFLSELTAMNGNKRKMAFYTHNAVAEPLSQMMTKMMEELKTENKMVILHFGGDGAYYIADLPTSEDDVNKFVADFHAGSLTRLQANPPR